MLQICTVLALFVLLLTRLFIYVYLTVVHGVKSGGRPGNHAHIVYSNMENSERNPKCNLPWQQNKPIIIKNPH